MLIQVECYAGHQGEETPRRFFLGSRGIVVDEVIDRWHGADHRYFKVRATDRKVRPDDRGIYILRHDTVTGNWELTMFRSALLPP